MPFQYTPYQNQYVGSIADLMGRGRDAEAQALITAANAQAQAAQISGQAWGGALQGIGNTVAKGITDWNSPEARQQRWMDTATEIAREGAAEQHPVMVEDVMNKKEGKPLPRQSMLGASIAGSNLFSPEQDGTPQSTLLGFSPSRTLPLPTFGQQSPPGDTMSSGLARSPFMQPFADRPSEGQIGQRELLDDSGDPVMRGRYTLDNGQYDSASLLRDLIAAGIPLDTANAFAAQGVQANTILAAGADISERYRESQLKIQGAVAGMALSAIEIGVSPEEAVNQATPGGDAIAPEQLRQFRVMFHQKTPEEQVQILEEIRHRASFLGEQTILPVGSTLLSTRTGDVLGMGSPRDPTPVTQGGFGDYFQRFWKEDRAPTQQEYDDLIRRWNELKRERAPIDIYHSSVGFDRFNKEPANPAPSVAGGFDRFNTGGPANPAPPVVGAPTGGQAPDGVPAIPMNEEEQAYLASLDGQVPDLAPAVQPRLESREAYIMQQAGPTPKPEERSRLISEYEDLTRDRGPTVAVSDVPVEQRDPIFQTFLTPEEGRQAQRALWLTEPYQKRTVRAAIKRWSPDATEAHVNEMLAAANASNGEKPMREVSDTELNALMDVQQKWEGWIPPTATTPASRSYLNNNPGNIKRTDNGASALGDLPPDAQTPADPAQIPADPAQIPADPAPNWFPDTSSLAMRDPQALEDQYGMGDMSPTEEAIGRGYDTYGSPELEVADGMELEIARDDQGQLYDADQNPLDPSELENLGVNNSGVYKIQTYPPVQVRNLGNVLGSSFSRVFTNLNSRQEAQYIKELAELNRQGAAPNQIKEVLYSAALLGEDVTTKNQTRGRYATIRALQDTLVLLDDMEAAGIEPGFLRGSLEDLYRRFGKTSNPAYAMLRSRIGAMVIQYRRAATGVQFGVQEKEDYEELMPGYGKNMEVNRGAIAGLIRSMNVHNASYWETKIGGTNAPVMFPELYPWVPNKNDFALDEIRTGHDGVKWYRSENAEEPLIEIPWAGQAGWTDKLLSGLNEFLSFESSDIQ